MEDLTDNPLFRVAATIKNSRIAHDHYLRAVKQIWACASIAESGEAVVQVGPSRAGKSRAVDEAMLMVAPKPPDQESGPERTRPILKLRTRNTAKFARFRSKDFYAQALARQQHPIYGIEDHQDKRGRTLAAVISDTSEDHLVEAFVQTLQAEKTKFLVIDEVQHLRYMEGGHDAAHRMLDSWKSIAEEHALVLVLCGAYPMLDILDGTPHLWGRAIDFEFPRYRTSSEDVESFDAVVETLEQMIPWRGGRISAHRDFLHQGCLGCIGLLLKWFRRAIPEAVLADRRALEIADLEASMANVGATESLLAEIETGERRWQERLGSSHTSDENRRDRQRVSPGKSANTSSKRQSRPKAKPFRAKPRNYKRGNRT